MSNPDPDLTDAELLALKAKAASLVEVRPGASMAASIVRAMSKNLSDAEWIALYRGVQPVIIPLTPKQLEAVRGGSVFDELTFPFPPFPYPGT